MSNKLLYDKEIVPLDAQKATSVRSRLRNHVNDMLDIVDEMPNKGDKCEDSQKICLITSINNLEHIINGIKSIDFIEE